MSLYDRTTNLIDKFQQIESIYRQTSFSIMISLLCALGNYWITHLLLAIVFKNSAVDKLAARKCEHRSLGIRALLNICFASIFLGYAARCIFFRI